MERRTVVLIGLVLLAFPASLGLRQLAPDHRAADPTEPCQRVVSLAPSITETLFALGLGDRVVGVSTYCSYPPEAQSRPKVGALFDPNYEAMVALQPDLVVMTVEHHAHREHLEQLGLSYVTVDHQQIGGILASFGILGEQCGVADRALALEAELRGEMERHRRAIPPGPRPTVLIVVGRELGTGVVRDPVVAGRDGFYDELIELSGGANAYADGEVRFPTISGEGLLVMDPDVIVDLVPDLELAGVDAAAVRADWESLPQLRAVRSGRVHVFEGQHMVVPGPRFPIIVDELEAVLHPAGTTPAGGEGGP